LSGHSSARRPGAGPAPKAPNNVVSVPRVDPSNRFANVERERSEAAASIQSRFTPTRKIHRKAEPGDPDEQKADAKKDDAAEKQDEKPDEKKGDEAGEQKGEAAEKPDEKKGDDEKKEKSGEQADEKADEKKGDDEKEGEKGEEGEEKKPAAEKAPAVARKIYRSPVENAPKPALTVPTEDYVVPFDTAPLSAPGEKIIFGGEFKDPTPANFRIKLKGAGGDFDSAGSGTKNVTYAGLTKDNIYFFIDSKWDKSSAVNVTMEVERIGDSSVVFTRTWSFGAKKVFPTTITQSEGEGEMALGSSYTYTLGPSINKGGPSYEHQTVLEEFGAQSCNLNMKNIKPEFLKKKGLATDQAICDYFFGTDAGSNGTFTISNKDTMRDQHDGWYPNDDELDKALVKPMEVYVDLPQIYSAEPGKPLGKYTVRRIRKIGGAKMLKKWKT
jgi:hypothetical protein